jgi:hypothetical protein
MVSAAARKHLEAHIAGERARDIKALMAPLAANPSYAVPGFILRGRPAVEEMYRRVLDVLSPELSDEYLRALHDPAVTRWGQDHCVIEYNETYPLHWGMVVIIHFKDDLIVSENTYFTSARGFAQSLAAGGMGAIPGAIPNAP